MTTKPLGSFDIITDKSGKTRVVANRKAQLAKLSLPKRIAAEKGKTTGVRVVRRGPKA